MPTTTEEFTFAQSWIGTNESRGTFDERLDRLLLVYSDREEAVSFSIEESIRAQYAAMAANPTSMSLPGGLSASWGGSQMSLEKLLADFRGTVGSRKATVTRLERYNPR